MRRTLDEAQVCLPATMSLAEFVERQMQKVSFVIRVYIVDTELFATVQGLLPCSADE